MLNPYDLLDWEAVKASFSPNTDKVAAGVFVCPQPLSNVSRQLLQEAARSHGGYVLHKGGMSFFWKV